MAKDFDVYLKRLTECDLTIYSIPYRDGITAFNWMVIDSTAEFSLQDFIDPEVASIILNPQVEGTLKTDYEYFEQGLELDASAYFNYLYSLYPEQTGIEIDTNNVAFTETVFTDAKNCIEIVFDPVEAEVAKSAGSGESTIIMDSYVDGTLKTDFLNIECPIVFDEEVLDTQKSAVIHTESALIPDATLVELDYRLYSETKGTELQIDAEVIETEFHYSLGDFEDGMVMDISLLDFDDEKDIEVEEVLYLVPGVVDVLLTQFNEPEENGMEISFEATSIIKRHRLLYEMDDDGLAVYDDMTLDDVDYVIL